MSLFVVEKKVPALMERAHLDVYVKQVVTTCRLRWRNSF